MRRNRRERISERRLRLRVAQRKQGATPEGGWYLPLRNLERFRWLIALALLLSVGGHAVAIWTLPSEIFTDYERPEKKPNFSIELQLTPEPPPQPKQQQYVVTNPDVPENEPDETQNFSDRSQQLAQEEQSKKPIDEVVTSKGDREEAQDIVERQVDYEPVPQLNPGSPDAKDALMQSAEDAVLQIFAEPKPVAESQFDKATREEGIDTLLGDRPPVEKPDMILVDSVYSERVGDSTQKPQMPTQEQQSTESSQQRGQERVPMPSPRLDPHTIGVLRKSEGTTSRSGVRAENAKFSEYGNYLARLQEAVNARAHSLILNSSTLYSEARTRVVIVFSIDRMGYVTELKVKESSAGQLAVQHCIDAIRSRAPFGPWTQEMVDTLNEQEELTYSFLF